MKSANYQIKLTLIRDMLGTNPCDPAVLDRHIIEKQRSLILEKSKINSELNKYLDALPITEERREEEISAVFAALEKITGRTLTPEQEALAVRGDLEHLKQTFVELELKATTIFLLNPKTLMPCIGDHMIYGFLKASGEAIRKTLPKKNGVILQSGTFTNSVINQHVRCDRRFIDFDRDTKKNSDGSPYYNQRSLRAQTAMGPRIALAKSEVMEEGASLSFGLKIVEGSPLTEDVLRQLLNHGEYFGLGQWRNAGYGMFSYELQ